MWNWIQNKGGQWGAVSCLPHIVRWCMCKRAFDHYVFTAMVTVCGRNQPTVTWQVYQAVWGSTPFMESFIHSPNWCVWCETSLTMVTSKAAYTLVLLARCDVYFYYELQVVTHWASCKVSWRQDVVKCIQSIVIALNDSKKKKTQENKNKLMSVGTFVMGFKLDKSSQFVVAQQLEICLEQPSTPCPALFYCCKCFKL